MSPADPIAEAIGALTPRSIGPALLGGRIADLAVDPSRTGTWYVAVGSGGVWKTTNAGTTWQSLFDDQSSYSIGCVALDPQRPETVWIGTGEAVSGRHVAWGDGVYRSRDGGRTWSNMGLEHSEHIAAILVDPRDSDVVYVAAEGPLWSAGGERGLFKSTDGGGSWEHVLEIDDDTGITSAVFAPDDPDVIYAAAYQRRRSVRSFVGGGPGSGIHKSTDGGRTWRRMTEGLPDGEMGKIGLAVTPAAPELVYATIEAAEEKERGFYRSTTRGESWERRSKYLSGGTGPHYYQEIYASPTDAERVYQVDVYIHVTNDGGATFTNLEDGKHKHSDNHVIWIDPDNGRHLLVGTDAGLYETFDDGTSWRHFPNLPVSQFYRVAVDNSLPFTNVLAGAQDLGTLYGPTRTMHLDGVRNQDWHVPLGADGYQVGFDPDDPDTSYLEWQEGNIMRHDRRTMELTDIRPRPAPGDPPERWNWDTPILISPHRSARIYVASQRVWRSDDRGGSWTAVSPDLTTGRSRYELPTGGRVWSVDALYDHLAMSAYATITDLTESPITEGILYAGTDDGLVHVSDDGGTTWRRTGALPDLPEDAFINDVEASRHDSDTVFVVADDHKSGDYRPLLFESTDRGTTWRSLRGDLPDGTIVWSIAQDHVNPDLLFIGTEHGLRVSIDRGERWYELGTSIPTISFRDLAVQRRDADLVAASFGRGIYVLDDYGPLRTLTEEVVQQPATLFPVRDAWSYVPYRPMQARGQPTLGSTAFRAPNPPFGATFTYHLAAAIETEKERRRNRESTAIDSRTDVEFPGWDQLAEEYLEVDPTLMLVIRDDAGRLVRAIEAERTAGIHRTTWDLRLPAPDPVRLDEPGFQPPWSVPPRGPLAPGGRYTVELVHASPAGPAVLAGPQSFVVKATSATTDTVDDTAAFRERTADLARRVAGAAKWIETAQDRIRHLRAAIIAAPGDEFVFFARLDELHRRLEGIRLRLCGDPVRERLAEPSVPSIRAEVERVTTFHWDSTGPPTSTQQDAIDASTEAFEALFEDLRSLIDDELTRLTADVDAAGGPWTPR